jgi:hypothetical protein
MLLPSDVVFSDCPRDSRKEKDRRKSARPRSVREWGRGVVLSGVVQVSPSGVTGVGV